MFVNIVKKILVGTISDDIKQLSYEICNKHNVTIKKMETDKDHIHYLIEAEPTISISKIVNLMKSYTTYHIWQLHQNIYHDISGKNIPFGLTDILSVLLAMLVKRC